MNKIFFFDSETTGIPMWREPSNLLGQPHIVQLGALMVDEDTREVLDEMDVIVSPCEWEIPQVTIDIHGITNEHADEVGVTESFVIQEFIKMWAGHKRIAHNPSFDNRIIRIAIKRYLDEYSATRWKAGEYECTGQLAKKVMRMKKMPKLVEAYIYFFGREPAVTHNALPDARSCMEIYFAIKDIADSL